MKRLTDKTVKRQKKTRLFQTGFSNKLEKFVILRLLKRLEQLLRQQLLLLEQQP
jgi:hypothetical protein